MIQNVHFTQTCLVCFVLLGLLEALSSKNLAFSEVRFNTTQFSGNFIPAVARLWNNLPIYSVESVQLQKFKCGTNSFLLSKVL